MPVSHEWQDFSIFTDGGGVRETMAERLDLNGAFMPKPPDYARPVGGGLEVVTWPQFEKHYMAEGDIFEAVEFGNHGEVMIWTRDWIHWLDASDGVVEWMRRLPRNPPSA